MVKLSEVERLLAIVAAIVGRLLRTDDGEQTPVMEEFK